MKGYVLLFVLMAGVLLSLPPLFLRETPAGQAGVSTETVTETSRFTVQHSEDPSAVSDIDAFELTLYETMQHIAPDAPSEAIKAQAVACYTAFCYQDRTKEENTGVVTGGTFPTAYTETYWKEQWGEAYDANTAVYRTAVQEVFGKTLCYNNEPIMAVYHTMNAGKTESAAALWGEEVPYLQTVASPADALRVDQLSTITLTTTDVSAVLASLCPEGTVGEPSSWFGESVKTDAGTVTQITVCGQTFSGEQLMTAFSLPSAAFEVQVQSDQVIFTVHGRGHFVGMSVCGATAMAEDGHTWQEIVKHYYTGIDIV